MIPHDVVLSVLAVYLVGLNLFTFAIYGWDKHRAVHGGWRTSEIRLLTLAAIGGTPAALLARWTFRHKTSKQPFKTQFWIIVMLQIVAACAIALQV